MNYACQKFLEKLMNNIQTIGDWGGYWHIHYPEIAEDVARITAYYELYEMDDIHSANLNETHKKNITLITEKLKQDLKEMYHESIEATLKTVTPPKMTITMSYDKLKKKYYIKYFLKNAHDPSFSPREWFFGTMEMEAYDEYWIDSVYIPYSRICKIIIDAIKEETTFNVNAFNSY